MDPGHTNQLNTTLQQTLDQPDISTGKVRLLDLGKQSVCLNKQFSAEKATRTFLRTFIDLKNCYYFTLLL
jgi:hypothetical protein